jgi:hypothetical protein
MRGMFRPEKGNTGGEALIPKLPDETLDTISFEKTTDSLEIERKMERMP